MNVETDLCKGLITCSDPSVGLRWLTTGSWARNSGRKWRKTGKFLSDSSTCELSNEELLLLLDLLRLLSLVLDLVTALRLKKKPWARAPGPYSRSTRCWINDFWLPDELLCSSIDEPLITLDSVYDETVTTKKNNLHLIQI